MKHCFESEFCKVTYIKKDNVVFLKWKKFCSFDDYRKPTLFASQLLKTNNGSNFIIDAKDGFEDEKEDIEWGFQILLPDMAKSTCKKCVFILNKIPTIEEEIDLWTAEFKKYFEVYKTQSYEEAVKICTSVIK